MKYLYLILFVVLPIVAAAQSTFGKIINIPETAAELGAHLRLVNDELLVFTGQRCPAPLEEDACVGLLKFSLEGDLMSVNYIPKHLHLFHSISTVQEDTLSFLSIETSETPLNNIALINYNIQSDTQNSSIITRENNIGFVPSGIQQFSNSYFVYGHLGDLVSSSTKGFIKRYSQDFTKELSSWIIGENNFVEISDLRITDEDQLVFSFNESKVGSGGPEYPVKIISMDTSGNVINEFRVENGDASPRTNINLEIDGQSSVYFNYDTNFKKHRIAKLSAGFDTLLWDIELPTDYYPQDRLYSVQELNIAVNGDLIAVCSIDYIHQHIERVIGTAVIRIDSESGDVKWLKILSNEVVEPSPFDNSYAETWVYDFIELPSGNLAGVGEFIQATFTGVRQEIFLMSISEDGCIEGFDCDKDIYVLNSGESLDIFSSVDDLPELYYLNIYPNPTQDKLYIDLTDQNYDYQILNLQGQQMLQGKYQDHIAVDHLPAGIYFLQLSQEAQLYKAIKFVKE